MALTLTPTLALTTPTLTLGANPNPDPNSNPGPGPGPSSSPSLDPNHNVGGDQRLAVIRLVVTRMASWLGLGLGQPQPYHSQP